MNIAQPWGFDKLGRTASVDAEQHIRDLLLALMMTNPGERVNRPAFGGGLAAMVFAADRSELQTTLRFSCQAAVMQSLGALIDLRDLQVTVDGEWLTVDVAYVVKPGTTVSTLTFEYAA